jgi:hypothetical protein
MHEQCCNVLLHAVPADPDLLANLNKNSSLNDTYIEVHPQPA